MRIRYDKTVWVDNETPVDACRLNKIENALEQLFTLAISPSQIEAGNGITIKILDNGNIKFSVSSEPVLDILKAGPGIKIEKVEDDDNTIKISSNLDSGNYIDFDLDEETGKITVSSKKQIEEYETTEDFPETGESNILYIEKENDKLYYWKEDEYKNLSTQLLYNTSWKNLVDLRDNSQLIPGTFYRITDYVTTTSQEYTTSANHPFDIIVRADSENKLNENASAIQHEGDTYFQNCKLESWELKYSLDNDIDRFSWALESGDYIYVSDWLTEKATLDGTVEIDGETYYKWLRNDPNYENTSWFLTETNDFSEASYENQLSNCIVGRIYVDWDQEQQTYIGKRGEKIIAFVNENGDKAFWVNNLEKAKYDGTIEIDGETYHKWKKLENGKESSWYILTENGPGSFTDASVINNIQYDISGKICIDDDNNDEYVGGSDEKILGEAILQYGKGVIYYMKDEWNNECPYDFKNIMFQRWEIQECENCPSLEEENEDNTNGYYYGAKTLSGNNVLENATYGQESNWFYTFALKDLASNEWYDYTIVAHLGLKNDEGIEMTCYNNHIVEGTDEYNSGKGEMAKMLNNIVFFNCYGDLSDTSYSEDYSYCNNNRFLGECHSNTFGNNCRQNSFGNEFYLNSFGNNCFKNSFGNNCIRNTVGNSCQNNSFGNNCRQNSFGNSCIQNSFGRFCCENSSGNACAGNIFGNGFAQNTVGNYFQDSSFGNNCIQNSFGNHCIQNSFGNNCSQNSFGNNCIRNTFGNCCGLNIFGNYCQTISVFDGVQSCSVTGGTQQAPVKNAQILNGTEGATFNKLTITFAANKNYTQIAAKTTNGTLKIFNPADLV